MKVLCILFIIVFLSISSANTIRVPEDYSTIQVAINQSQPGDTVLISTGNYSETIIIDRSICIIGVGSDNTVINGNSYFDPAISIVSNNIQIKNIKIIAHEGMGNPTGFVAWDGQTAIKISSSNNIKLDFLEIITRGGGMCMVYGAAGGTGISIVDSYFITLKNTTIQTGPGAGGYSSDSGGGRGGHGIWINNSANVFIDDINISVGIGVNPGSGGRGFYLTNCDTVSINSSIVNGGYGDYAGAGSYVLNSTDIIVNNSSFTGGNSREEAGDGITLVEHCKVKIINTILKGGDASVSGNPAGIGGNGLTITDSSAAELSNCTLSGGSGLTNGFQYYEDATSSVIVGVMNSQMNPILTAPYLYQNYPNPFNLDTNISFSLPRPNYTNLAIYDIAGRLINTLLSRVLAAGNHNIVWDGLNLNGEEVSSGIYIVTFMTMDHFQSRKLILLK